MLIYYEMVMTMAIKKENQQVDVTLLLLIYLKLI